MTPKISLKMPKNCIYPESPMKVQIHGITDETINNVLAHRASQTMKNTNPTASFTPGQLSAEYGHSTNGDALPVYIKISGVTIAEMSARDNSALKAADALRIVQAVNSHADLLAALEDIRRMAASRDAEDFQGVCTDIESFARAAIARAKGL